MYCCPSVLQKWLHFAVNPKLTSEKQRQLLIQKSFLIFRTSSLGCREHFSSLKQSLLMLQLLLLLHLKEIWVHKGTRLEVSTVLQKCFFLCFVKRPSLAICTFKVAKMHPRRVRSHFLKRNHVQSFAQIKWHLSGKNIGYLPFFLFMLCTDNLTK